MAIVYRYYNNDDECYDYIGIVYSENRTLKQRVIEHSKEKQFQNANYSIDYFEVETHTDAEVWEAHLIAKYETNKRLNKSKAFWGTCSYLPDDKDLWIKFDTTNMELTDNQIAKDEEFLNQYGVYPNDILNFDILNRFCVWTQNNDFIADGITMNLIANNVVSILNLLGDRIALYTDKVWTIEDGKREQAFGFYKVSQSDTTDSEIFDLLTKFNKQDFSEFYENYKNGIR